MTPSSHAANDEYQILFSTKEFFIFSGFPLRIVKSELKTDPRSDTKMKLKCFLSDPTGKLFASLSHSLCICISKEQRSITDGGRSHGAAPACSRSPNPFLLQLVPSKRAQTSHPKCRQAPGGTAAINSCWSTPSSSGALCSTGDRGYSDRSDRREIKRTEEVKETEPIIPPKWH